MKLLIISDIHGSSYYANKILEINDKEKPDKIILLGDLYYHGPRNKLTKDYEPMEVANILNSLKDKILAVKGNCDAEVDQMISEFKLENNLELKVNDLNVFFTHGHRYNIDKLPKKEIDMLIYGHIHTGFIKEKDGIIVANAGSISLPKNDTKNSYLVLDEKQLILKDVEGNIIDKKNIWLKFNKI